MTQYDLIKEYIKQNGSIVPAKVGGSAFKDGFFGSETSKRCRELRMKGVLRSEPDAENPKFERFFLVSTEEAHKPKIVAWEDVTVDGHSMARPIFK